MKRYLAVILLWALLPISSAFAQQTTDPASKEDVQKLFDVMHSRKQFDSMMDVFRQQIPALTRSVQSKQLPNATPEDIAKLNRFVNHEVETMFDQMPYDELMRALMTAYQHHFTRQEIQELTAFYSSTTGQKVITEMPSIMTEYMTEARPAIEKWMQNRMDQLKADTEQYAESLKNTPKGTKAKPTS